jgi:perosamine synthetase
MCARLPGWRCSVSALRHESSISIRRPTISIRTRSVKLAHPRTRAVIVPHLFGLPADLTSLQSLGIPLIEDCAQTLGAMEQGRAVGTVGLLTVCSFYATKLLCTGEGGMVLSNDEALLERVRELREYDQAPSLNAAAFNCKMTDLQAAIGVVQLNQIGGVSREAGQRWPPSIASSLPAELFALRPRFRHGRTHVYYRFVVRLPKGAPVGR